MLKKYFLLCYFAGVLCCLFWSMILGYALIVQHKFSVYSLGAVLFLALITRLIYQSYYEEKRGQANLKELGADNTSATEVGKAAYSFSAASTSAAWPSAFTFRKAFFSLPSGPMMNVLRSMPITFRPYMFFSFQTSSAWASLWSVSASSGKGMSYFSANFFWVSGLSGEAPRTAAPAFLNLGYSSRNSDASTVQPGVLALG